MDENENENEKECLDKIKQDFLRMTSPFDFGSGENRCNSILCQNIPPMLARSAAAYAKAAEFLEEDILNKDLPERLNQYKTIQALFQEAGKNLTAVLLNLEEDDITRELQAIDHYLMHLNQMFTLLVNAVLTESCIAGWNEQFGKIFPGKHDDYFQQTEILASTLEKKLFQLLKKFVEDNHSFIAGERDRQRFELNKNDLERYQKSLKAFSDFFSCRDHILRDQ